MPSSHAREAGPAGGSGPGGPLVVHGRFFQDPAQFDLLVGRCLPGLDDPVVVWVAGCANGQEAYSVAMALAAAGRQGFRILATDVSPEALARTGSGRYGARRPRGLTALDAERYLRFRDGAWEVADALRAHVETLHHDLAAGPMPLPAGTCQVVFCREVLTGMTVDQQVSVLDRLIRWLPVGGWLFLGGAETERGGASVFQTVEVGDRRVYRAVRPALHVPARAQRSAG